MRVPKQITVLFLLVSFLTSTAAVLFIHSIHRHTDHRFLLAACISVILVLSKPFEPTELITAVRRYLMLLDRLQTGT